LLLALDSSLYATGAVDDIDLNPHLGLGADCATQGTQLTRGKNRFTLPGDDGHFTGDQAATMKTWRAGKQTDGG
jgi:hypothetical protein